MKTVDTEPESEIYRHSHSICLGFYYDIQNFLKLCERGAFAQQFHVFPIAQNTEKAIIQLYKLTITNIFAHSEIIMYFCLFN